MAIGPRSSPAMPFLLLMPSYNQARYVAEAVDSVLAQDDPDWELWIVDNSTDETPAVLSRYDDPRIRFHHFAERMSPGHCLNWMLERAQGRDFSYLHTDNRLRADYVRAMRAALAHDACALAYCDLYLIDARGRRKSLLRRGRFDLPRLLGMSPLGVPFSATTELARRVGGFSADDVADDVLFCTRAFGLAEWRYLHEPIMEYRHHEQSRTELHGGYARVQRALIATFAKALPELVARGLDPLGAMRARLGEIRDDLRLIAEDQVLRAGARGVRWWGEDDYLDGLWRAGLVPIPGKVLRKPVSPFALLATTRGGPSNPLRIAPAARPIRHAMRRAIEPRAGEFEQVLLGLVQLEFGLDPVPVRRTGADVISRWAEALIVKRLGWPVAHARTGDGKVLELDFSGRGASPVAAHALVL
jgi:glycosyltransferase involved in cell wall biosynthesis